MTFADKTAECGLIECWLSRNGTKGFELILNEASDFASDHEISEFITDLQTSGQNSNFAITSLFVHQTFLKGLSDTQQDLFFQSLPGVEDMCITSATISCKVLSNFLQRAQCLQKLCLDKVVILSSGQSVSTDQALLHKALRTHPTLKQFHLSLAPPLSPRAQGNTLSIGNGNNLDSLLNSLSKVQSLTTVYISFPRRSLGIITNPLSLATLVASVQDFTLKNCPLNREHCSCIANLINQDSPLQALSLIGCDIGDSGALALGESFKRSNISTLKKLYLPSSGIRDEGLAAFADSFRTKLEVLDLHDNMLTLSATSSLNSLLVGDDCKLQFLDVSRNPLGDTGGCTLANALQRNVTLQQLNLLQCNLSNLSCQALATAFLYNQSLKILNLYDNGKIDEQGIDILTACMQENSVFESLVVRSTSERNDIDFYPRLNRVFNRGKLLSHETTEKEYVVALHLASILDDLSALFYFLQSRPALCLAAILPPEKKETISVPTSKEVYAQRETKAKELYSQRKTSRIQQPALEHYRSRVFSTPQA